MRRWVAALTLPLIVSFALAGCGAKANSTTTPTTTTTAAATCPASPQKAFVKTRFVTDIGLIVGTTRHFIYKPYTEGKFTKGAHGRIFALLKAGAAVAAIVHLTHNAIDNAKADPILCKVLIKPLTDIATALGSVVSKIKGGNLSAVTDLNSTASTLESTAKSQGLSVVSNVMSGI